MLIWPILLRIVLTVGLILNGSGYAAASVPATFVGDAVAGQSESAKANCHQQQQRTVAGEHHLAASSAIAHATSTATATAPEAPAPAPAPHEGCDPEGCDPEGCECSCAQNSAAFIAGAFRRDAVIGRDTSGRVLMPARASPALPHLIRPPIS